MSEQWPMPPQPNGWEHPAPSEAFPSVPPSSPGASAPYTVPPDGDSQWVPAHHARQGPARDQGYRESARMRRGVKGALIAGACAVVVGAAGFGGYTLLGGTSNTKPTGHTAPAPANVPTALTASEIAHTASDFLAAWSSGDIRKAAGLTDNAAQAADRLTAYRTQLHATSVALTGKPAKGTTVPFTVNARFRYNGQNSTWRYDSALSVARDPSGRAVVTWAPSVLYPTLGAGQTLGTESTAAPALRILDRNGKVLTAGEFPSLGPVLGQLQAAYGTATGGSAATAIRVKGTGGKSGAVLHRLSQGRPGRPLRTTLDAGLQAAAEQAVKTKGPDASTVVIQPSTGAILAIANQPAGGFDKAMSGTYAPGSTFKLITASAALETGKVAPGKPLDCPKTYQYGGQSFHNVSNFSLRNATLAQDFAQSCNTAFISTATFMSDTAVSSEAHDVFGIGLGWSVGVPAYSGSVPAAAGSRKAMSYIGQGNDLMSPLAMASVVSTVKAGGFHQPFIVSPSVDGRTVARAPRQLSASVAAQVRSMMRLTAQSGTAAPAMAGLSGDIGAKTGTTEVDGQAKPNSWFVAYRGDMAAAAVVPKSGEGYKFAGPIVAAILKAAN